MSLSVLTPDIKSTNKPTNMQRHVGLQELTTVYNNLFLQFGIKINNFMYVHLSFNEILVMLSIIYKQEYKEEIYIDSA